MKRTLKAAAQRLIAVSVACLERFRVGRFVCWRFVDEVMSRRQTVEHQGLRLTFATPNDMSLFRAKSFSYKEPETLEWIDAIPRAAVLWDVGANVGLYACYAALRRECRVFAFEPSVFNLELLARNVFLNGLADRVTIVPLPLSEALAVSKLNMTTTTWGGAMSTFGESYGHDGRPLNKIFEFSTIGVSMSDAVDRLKIPQPDYIKMDVDGIEHVILGGGTSVLKGVKGILIEINDAFAAQASGARAHLEAAGFVLREKRHADIRLTGGAPGTFNQIWAKA